MSTHNVAPKLRYFIAAMAVLLFAAFMNLYHLTSYPPGLDPDAGWDGVEALKPLRYGLWPFYILNNSNADPIFIYSQALLTGLLGAKVLTLRLPSAWGGLIGIAALYPALAEMGRRGFDPTSRRRIALLGMAALASSEMLAFVHRLGERFAIQPMFQLAAIWALLRATCTGERRYWIAAGALAGLTQYTYSAARAIPALLLIVLLLGLPWGRWTEQRFWRGLAIFLAAAVLVLLPQIVFYARNPALLVARASQISLTQNPAYAERGLPGVVLLKLSKYWEALGAHWLGQYDQIKAPLLAPLFYRGFAFGLFLCLLFFRRRLSWMLVAGTLVMLLPEMLAGDRDYPHELRAIGAYPFVAGIAGLGLGGVWSWARRRRRADVLTGGVLGAMTLLTFYSQAAQFFGPHRDTLHWSGNVWLRRVDKGIADVITHSDEPFLLPLSNYSDTVVKYLTADRAQQVRSALNADGDLLPLFREMPEVNVLIPHEDDGSAWRGDPTQWVLFKGDMAYLLPPLPEMGPNLTRLENERLIRDREDVTELGRMGQLKTELLSLPAGFAAQFPVGLCFERGLCLRGVNFSTTALAPGADLTVNLLWYVIGRPDDDYRVFVHLLDRNGRGIAGSDDYPLHHGYRTYEWQRNETIISSHTFAVPVDLTPGAYAVEIGLYSLPHVERLGLLNEQGQVVADRVYLERLKVARPPAHIPTEAEPAEIVFADQLELAAYRFKAAPARGQLLDMTLWWRGLRPAEQHWTAFFHLTPVEDNATILAQIDRPPTGGDYPPTVWDAGEIVEDHLALRLPPDLAPGRYAIWVGLYSPLTFERVAITASPHQVQDNRTLQAEFEIE